MVSYALLAVQPDLRLCVPMLASVTAIVTVLLAVTLYVGERGSIPWGPRTILVVAVISRLLFMFRPPELSSDIYRYLWDGLQFLAGSNPYTLAPSEVLLHSEPLAHLAGQINNPHLVTIYPPAAQVVFAAGAALGWGVLGVKILFTTVDFATCYLLVKLIAGLELPPWRAVLYAWHPLPVLEIAGSGHIDGAAVFFLVVALLLLVSRRSNQSLHRPGDGFPPLSPRRVLSLFFSGLAFAFASLVKLFPLLFLPGFLAPMAKRTSVFFCSGVLLGGVCLTFPFVPDILNGVRTLGIYARDWEFSGFLYQVLRGASLPGIAARWALSSFFLFCVLFLCADLFRKRGGAYAPNASVWPPGRSRNHDASCKEDLQREIILPMLRVFHGIAMAFLLFTPTLFPWYALYLVGLLPFTAGPGGLVISWSVLLSYEVFIPYAVLGQWAEDARTSAAIWLAPVAAFLLSLLAGKLKERNASSVMHADTSVLEDTGNPQNL